jgi:hypothetical protein
VDSASDHSSTIFPGTRLVFLDPMRLAQRDTTYPWPHPQMMGNESGKMQIIFGGPHAST